MVITLLNLFLRRMYKECHGDLSRMDLLDAVEQVAVVGMTVRQRETEKDRERGQSPT